MGWFLQLSVNVREITGANAQPVITQPDTFPCKRRGNSRKESGSVFQNPEFCRYRRCCSSESSLAPYPTCSARRPSLSAVILCDKCLHKSQGSYKPKSTKNVLFCEADGCSITQIHHLPRHANCIAGIIQIDHHPDATVFQFIILTFIYSSTCFGRSPAHHQELNDCSSSLWFYLHIVVIAVPCSW